MLRLLVYTRDHWVWVWLPDVDLNSVPGAHRFLRGSLALTGVGLGLCLFLVVTRGGAFLSWASGWLSWAARWWLLALVGFSVLVVTRIGRPVIFLIRGRAFTGWLTCRTLRGCYLTLRLALPPSLCPCPVARKAGFGTRSILAFAWGPSSSVL